MQKNDKIIHHLNKSFILAMLLMIPIVPLAAKETKAHHQSTDTMEAVSTVSDSCSVDQSVPLSQNATKIVHDQIMGLVFFPKKDFSIKEYPSGSGKIYHIDPESSEAIRIYREGVLAGYLYHFENLDEALLKEAFESGKKNLSNNSSSLIDVLSTGVYLVGLSSGETDYLASYGIDQKEIISYSYLMQGFLDGRNKFNKLKREAIQQINKAKNIQQKTFSDNNDILPQTDLPALEALIFLKKEFERKTETDKNSYMSLKEHIMPHYAPAQRANDEPNTENETVKPK